MDGVACGLERTRKLAKRNSGRIVGGSGARHCLALAASNALPLAAIAGHSFGGKVALEVARLEEIPSLSDVDRHR